jgi:magnesium transporter
VDSKILPHVNSLVRDVACPAPVRLLEVETVNQALSRLRGECEKQRAVYFYVVDVTERLVGVAPTRGLLFSHPTTLVGEVMVHPVFSVSESATFGRALAILAEQRLLALPVVDELGRLTGVVVVSTATQTLFNLERREAADERFQLLGVPAGHETERIPRVLPSCFSSLLVSIASGLLAALLVSSFQNALRGAVAVGFFIPLVMTLAQYVAMQAVAASLQALHVVRQPDSPTLRDVRKGLLVGIACAVLVGLFVAGWLRSFPLAVVVACSVLAGSASGEVLGYCVPRLVRRWRLNPRIASGPVVFALTNLTAIFCYLAFAAVIYP